MDKVLNPVEKRIAGGMSAIAAYLTEATCGEACWSAREDVCRCSCGGKNHGCMRTADGVQPERSAKIDGFRYFLKAVDGAYEAARKINKAHGAFKIGRSDYTFYKNETDKGAPARMKLATHAQVDTWPELTADREKGFQTTADGKKYYRSRPYLLWVREDIKLDEPAAPAAAE